MDLNEQLRARIRLDQRSPYRIAELVSIPRPSLYRYLNRQRGLTLQHVTRLVEVLDLELRQSRGGTDRICSVHPDCCGSDAQSLDDNETEQLAGTTN